MAFGLKFNLRWRPDIQEFTAPLRLVTPPRLKLNRLQKGIDNAHVDVLLSAEFSSRTRQLARRILLHEVSVNHWGEPPPAPDSEDLETVRSSYVGMMEVAVDRARQGPRYETIQLLQFAVLKQLLQVVDSEFERLRNQLQRARSMDTHKSNGRSLELHDRLVILAKEEAAIKYSITTRLFREISKLEVTRLSKLRRSVLGQAWPLPRQMMFNPVLQMPSLWSDEQMMRHYTLLCTDPDSPELFARANRLVTHLFSDYLPEWSWAQDEDDEEGGLHGGASFSTALRVRKDQGELGGFLEVEMLLGQSLQNDEYEQGLHSWLDFPRNLDRIVYSVLPRDSEREQNRSDEGVGLWKQEGWPGFHRRLIKRIMRRANREGLVNEALACHAAPKVYEELNRQLPVRLICQYLAGNINRRVVQRKFVTVAASSNKRSIDPVRVLKVLDRARNGLKYMHPHRRQRHYLSFLRNFATLRHDLKMAYQAHWAMNQVRILNRPKDIELSRNNGTLHEFVLRQEMQPEQHRIRNHVILKADVRGSTSMTSQLRRRNLNPASYFSLNFFEPINKLLSDYGAKKVFVEGDAVILSIVEYEDTPYQWLCVSHACGLAQKILHVVDVQNVKNRGHDLPELELGLGVAFSDEPPTFLYDENREIMISSAINRADRLSSCSATLRRSRFGQKLGRGIEVVAPQGGENLGKESVDKLVHYNVNGIELEQNAFNKLRSELALKLVVDASLGGEGERFHVGRYPDIQGQMHWVVIREAPVRVWVGDAVGDVELMHRSFYETVTDENLIARVVDRSSGRRGRGVTDAEQLHEQEQKLDISNDRSRFIH
ncbi:MAG: hypothetical protein GY696_31570 [Gammaproteobacteria bacterium]|nr:hypothetical protein [Gammaproteobacteria bacterium]